MAIVDSLSLGRYQPGTSLLHRLSAGFKLGALPLLVIVSFSCSHPGQLVCLALLALGLTLACGLATQVLGRGLWSLRYLLLVTLLLHLLLSPGRTLFGLPFLSYDGLLHGGRIVTQLCLGVTFSSLLTLTTPPESLVSAVDLLLAPFARLGLAVGEVTLFLSLVLYFIPVLREEAVKAAVQVRQSEPLPDNGLLARAREVRALLGPLVRGLIVRAEEVALRLHSGEALFEQAEGPSSAGSRFSLGVACAVLLLFLWMLWRVG